MGTSGSGKSALAAALSDSGEITSGSVTGADAQAGVVSLHAQGALIERERLRDDSDITDRVTAGTSVQEMLDEASTDPALLSRLIELFKLGKLLKRGFRKLSTGETRKVLFTRALTSKPNLLVIDGPFEGLDVQTVPLISDALQHLSTELQLVLVINRLDELPKFVTHVAFLEKGRLKSTMETCDQESMGLLSQLFHLKTTDIHIPVAPPGEAAPPLNPGDPLVNIRNACIRYTDNLVFEHLNWRIEPGQHWQLTGPNGSGKTCLLNLITGDHPQCYNNDIFVCGYQYDSIGLYAKATELQKEIAGQWLDILGLRKQVDQPFNQFSYGDQRLLLIARAMVKHPHLLILDEPCFGLDDLNRQLVLALVEKICAGSESTVIYVNHHAQDQIEGINQYLALD
jgi:molybdate transport system ATP-binding protein